MGERVVLNECLVEDDIVLYDVTANLVIRRNNNNEFDFFYENSINNEKNIDFI